MSSIPHEAHETEVKALKYRNVPAPPLEADNDPDGHDFDESKPALNSWRSTLTQDLSTSIEQHKPQHAFHYPDEYLLSDDENEINRLDMQHAIFRYALDGHLTIASIPKEDLRDVLDVGCGTGLWAIEVAEEVPSAQVLGFDIRANQPKTIPSNCNFLVADVNADWTFSQSFDLIHTRCITPAIKDWPKYLRQAKDVLKPGGWIECHEASIPAGCTDATANPKPLFLEMTEGLGEAGPKLGLDFETPSKLGDLLHETGFQNITVQWQRWPCGTWAKGTKNKEIGRLWKEDMKVLTRAARAFFVQVLGWEEEEFERFGARIREEIDGGEKHVWLDVCFAYAQKPY